MSPKVLFVDDEIAILNGIKLNLGRTFEISLANGADEALKMMEEDGPFEVVVSDMRMPGRSGVEVLAHAKSMQPDVMTILLTIGSNVSSMKWRPSLVRLGEWKVD